MSNVLVKRVAVSVGFILSLVSCGGGGDVAGDAITFSVTPDKSTLSIITTVDGDCSGAAGEPWSVVAINGGQPPFRIVNADPARADVDRTEATGKDPQFRVRPTGYACGEVVISVFDYHSKLVTYTFKVEAKKVE